MSCLGSFGILKPAAPARRDSVMELERAPCSRRRLSRKCLCKLSGAFGQK